jgi:hypothetical protein
MSAWADKLRGPVGDGNWDKWNGTSRVVIGHPHLLWQEMCDVVEAASRANSHLRLGYRVPFNTRRDLDRALSRLKDEIA